ncbi:hypothetical protein [Comamonas odontotermitis]|uniref:hypothetical protein n=1 Tax=Comamonas TaxID=283 RepID=UPI001CC35CED|nr:hypothetical protein [Comamonas odontotermitis]UBB18097.1 hypothetical protein LAD35_05520 [Comamonas odontotermitis]
MTEHRCCAMHQPYHAAGNPVMSANGAVCKRMFAIVFAYKALSGWALETNLA